MSEIIAIDIETAADLSVVGMLPPVRPDSRLKDPAKIEADIADKQAEQVAKMPLKPFYGRICTISAVNDDQATVASIRDMSDGSEASLISDYVNLLRLHSNNHMHLVTWNGMGFDLPYIYQRAMILGVDMGAPLSYWSKRYTYSPHCDLMQAFTGWSGHMSLAEAAKRLLSADKVEVEDIAGNHKRIEAGEFDLLNARCLSDARLTWQLYKRAKNCLF